MAVALHAARLGRAAAGSGCLIVGAGSQGLLLLLVLRALGAEVAVVEPHDGRLAIARSLGAQPMVRTAYELVFETSGSVGGTQQALRSLGVGGTLVLIGIPHDDVPLSTASIVRGHATVMGSIIYDHPGDFSDTLAFIADNSLSPVVDHPAHLQLQRLPGRPELGGRRPRQVLDQVLADCRRALPRTGSPMAASFTGVVVLTCGAGPLGGQFDHQVKVGGRNLHQFGPLEQRLPRIVATVV